MRLVPVIRGPCVDLQRHRQQHRRERRVLHHVLHHRQRRRHLVLGHLENQFVMHLHSICAESFFAASASSIRIMARRMMSAAVPCRRALIDGALVEGADRGVGGLDIGIVHLAAEQRGDVAVLAA